jgi:hypothetical protein
MKKAPATLLFVLLIASLALNALHMMPMAKDETGLDGELGTNSPEPPLPDRSLLTPTNCAIGVVNHLPGHTMNGYGIPIRHEGKTIVLTSQMILTRGVGAMVVRLNGKEYPASVLKDNKNWGLAALAVYTDDRLPAVKLLEQYLPIGAEALVPLDEPHRVRVKRYTKWMILSGGIPRNSCGAPVLVDDELVGLVIGVNRKNMREAVAADARTLLEFAGEAIQAFGPPPTAGGIWPGRRRHLAACLEALSPRAAPAWPISDQNRLPPFGSEYMSSSWPSGNKSLSIWIY